MKSLACTNLLLTAGEQLGSQVYMLILAEQVAEETTWSPWLTCLLSLSLVVCLGKSTRFARTSEDYDVSLEACVSAYPLTAMADSG